MLTVNRSNYMDAARALHWYCADYHSGQNSALYSIMSALDYRPGAPEGAPNLFDDAWPFYVALVDGDVDAQTLADSIRLILDTDA